MKTTTLSLILFLTGLDLWAQTPTVRMTPQRPRPQANGTTVPAAAPSMPTPLPSLPNAPASPSGAQEPGFGSAPSVLPNRSSDGKEVPAYEYNWTDISSQQILDIYAGLVNRTLLRAANLPNADHIVLKTQQKLTKTEAIEALEAVLALNGISIVPIGDKFAKVVPTADAGTTGGALDDTPAEDLPNLGSYVTHITQLRYVKPSVMQGIIAPLGKVKDIIPIDDNGILVIRDYAENVKRMLQMIAQIDVSSPMEYTNEVIEIKYALADDIANALNNLGGQGSSTVAIGTSQGNTPISGISGANGRGSAFGGTTGSSTTFGGNNNNNYNNQSRFGSQATTTAAGSNGRGTTGSTFQQRLQNIIQNAAKPSGGGSQDEIQVFGQAKIIADARANSLLVFATRADMERIKAVVDKLDVLLAQVLIESAIMDVNLNKGWNFGVSMAQNPKTVNGNPQIKTAGGLNNGQSFLDFLGAATGAAATNLFPGNTTTVLPANGLSYFGNIGPTFDVAIQAAANDNSVTVIQRPRIQTSQAKPAQFFVGSTVPYITGTTYGTGFGGGNSSSYSQLSVGIELDVTPFINPDGLVVMDINQEIDDISGSTVIDGNSVPNTDKRTLSSEIAVRDKDTVMLGGFIRAGQTKGRSGIPILQDIPILGALFSSRSSSHDRQELIVLMRPTVLKTPEIAAAHTLAEEQRLPGIMQASAENDKDEAKQVAAEERAAKQRAKVRRQNNDFFTPVPAPTQVDTNLAMPLP